MTAMPPERTASPLVPLLDRIYETGAVETEDGDSRPAEPVGVPRAHALRLAGLVRGQGLLSTLETGMAYGLSTMAIAGVHAARGAGRHIAIDPTVHGAFEGIGVANVRRAGLEDRVRVIAEGSQHALPRLVEEATELDFAFIDGNHTFDHALIDFFYSDLMLRSGGYLAFHDLWMPAVQDVLAYVLSNRSYEQQPGADAGMVVLRKLGVDARHWTQHRAFARARPADRPVEQEARALFDELSDQAEEAAEAAGGFRQHDIVLAGSPVRMRFAGSELESAILPAFSHGAAVHSGPPELDIVLWDGAGAGGPPSVPWSVGDVRARGDVRGFEDGPVSAFSDPGSGSITVFDRERAAIVYWVMDARAIPWHERGAPLRAALHLWAAGGGRHFIHAGAVGSGGGGVLLGGASGSGKSTTALSCLEAGFDYAGDDYVVVTGDEAMRAHCLYSTAKLDATALDRLPGLSAAVVHFERGVSHKAVLDLHAHRPERVCASLPVDAIVLPSVSERREQPTLRRAGAAEALRALAPTTLLQLPGAAQARMTAMAALVRRVPVLGLELGTDMTAVPDLVASICADPVGARDGA